MPKRPATRSPARRAGGNIARMLLNNAGVFGLNFLTTVIVSRWLLPEGKGVYSLAILIPMTLANVGNYGLPLAFTHHVGKRREYAPQLVGNATLIALSIGVAYIVGFLAFDRFEPLRMFANIATRYKVLAIGILPLLLWNHFASSVLLGLDRQRAFRRIRLIEAMVLLAGILGGVVLGGGHIAAALAAWLASHVTVTVLNAIVLHRAGALRLDSDWALMRRCLRFGLQGWGGILASFLLLRSDLFLVNYFQGAESVGHYSVSAALFMLMALLPMSAFTSFLPQATQMEGAGARELTRMASRVMTAACAALACASYFPARYLVLYVFGDAYAPAVRPLLILLPALTLLGAGAITNAALQGMGRIRYHTYSNVAALLLNVALNVWWIPRWGIAGAAAASTIAYLTMAAIQVGGYAWATNCPIADLLVLRHTDINMIRNALARRFARGAAAQVQASTTN